jgi:hypothetical protein
MVRTFLKGYMELGSSFLFLQEQIKDIIIIADLWLGHCDDVFYHHLPAAPPAVPARSPAAPVPALELPPQPRRARPLLRTATACSGSARSSKRPTATREEGCSKFAWKTRDCVA